MNFLQVIKRDMYDEKSRRGFQNKCIVDTRALCDLIDNFERLDSFVRSQNDMHTELEQKLSNVLQAFYCENHDSERLMLLIMKILGPMIERRIKESTINNIYNRCQI